MITTHEPADNNAEIRDAPREARRQPFIGGTSTNEYSHVPHPYFPTASICTGILFRILLAGEADKAERDPQSSALADPDRAFLGETIG
jgi:hypothetical protein